MARWSPTVESYRPRPLDFSPISQAIESRRAERDREAQRKRQAEQDARANTEFRMRAREAGAVPIAEAAGREMDDLSTALRDHAGEVADDANTAFDRRSLESLQKHSGIGPRQPTPSSVTTLGGPVHQNVSRALDRLQQRPRATSIQVGGEEWSYNPDLVRRDRSEEELRVAEEKSRREAGGQVQGRIDAIRASVPGIDNREAAERAGYYDRPAGLTFDERRTLQSDKDKAAADRLNRNIEHRDRLQGRKAEIDRSLQLLRNSGQASSRQAQELSQERLLLTAQLSSISGEIHEQQRLRGDYLTPLDRQMVAGDPESQARAEAADKAIADLTRDREDLRGRLKAIEDRYRGGTATPPPASGQPAPRTGGRGGAPAAGAQTGPKKTKGQFISDWYDANPRLAKETDEGYAARAGAAAKQAGYP